MNQNHIAKPKVTVRDLNFYYGKFHALKNTRARMLSTNTAKVTSKAPPQAKRIQLSYGLMANW